MSDPCDTIRTLAELAGGRPTPVYDVVVCVRPVGSAPPVVPPGATYLRVGPASDPRPLGGAQKDPQ